MTAISRREAADGSRIQLQAETEGSLHDVTITIPERSPEGEEAERELEKTAQTLDYVILGKNKSLDHVEYDLILPASFEKTEVTAEWASSRPDILAWNGIIQPGVATDGTDVTISGILTLGSRSMKVERIVTVYPSKEETALEKELQAETVRLNENSEVVSLPQELHGSRVVWYLPEKSYGTGLVIFTLILGILIPLSIRQKQEEARKKRMKWLEMEYPDLAGKILLLTGAGLSMRKVFERIGLDYMNQKKRREEKEKGRKKHVFQTDPACEEILHSVRDLHNGMPEGEVYRNFGERCGLASYRGLALLLEQNLSKGGTGMTQLLEAEAADAYAKRRRLAKEEGEKSSIRMAVPMIMMLMVVMIVLMVPAMGSF
ncbi:MAG: hypothetical protein U0L49_02345 [Eubacterium sp.]|nr:hypothetical protein [Eubacterium sp.]